MIMNNESVTLLTTWDNEVIEIPFSFETWLSAKMTAKQNWEDWIYLKKQNRYLKFSNIKDEKGKIKYLALPDPTEEKNKREAQRIQYEIQKIYNTLSEEERIDLYNQAKKSLASRSNIFKKLIDNPLVSILIEHEKVKLMRKIYKIN